MTINISFNPNWLLFIPALALLHVSFRMLGLMIQSASQRLWHISWFLFFCLLVLLPLATGIFIKAAKLTFLVS